MFFPRTNQAGHGDLGSAPVLFEHKNSTFALSIFMLFALADYEVPLAYIAETLLVVFQIIVHAVPEDCV